MTRRLLVINGSVRGREGNTGELLEMATKHVPPGNETQELVLATYEASVEASRTDSVPRTASWWARASTGARGARRCSGSSR